MSKRIKKGRDINGVLLLDKASGYSSNAALQNVKYLFNANKAGHTGSLDPLASGLLPICFGQSTKIVNRKNGEITYGKIPPYSVVVPGSLPDKNNPTAPSLSCAVIIKQVDEKTRSKTSINELLRE